MQGLSEIEKKFGNRIRVRACGICIVDEELLLVKHTNIGKKGCLWAPPGGGVSFGENVEECLVREFKEETGLEINVGKFLFACEFVAPPLHAIELFFLVQPSGGKLIKGLDPEIKDQIIEEVRFCNANYIKSLDKESLHKILQEIEDVEEIKSFNGFLK
jgi:8-oxo-dGTP diphosphatase